MNPFFFGPQRCFGWFHPARGPARTPVLICGSAGWEALASQRALRALAEELSAAGFPALRFDLPGTGDSPGSGEEEDLVERWLASLDEAVRTLQELSGARDIAVFGVHLGATLAARIALRHSGIRSAVLWGGFAKGARYLRELRAYRALNGSDGADGEGAGLVLPPGAVRSLQTLRLAPAPAPQGCEFLALSRDDAGADELASELQSLGAQVELRTGAGYAAMMQEPRKSVIPSATFRSVIDWLQARPGSSSVNSVPYFREPRLTLFTEAGYRESPHWFGGGLFAIATEPAGAASRTGVLFLNSASDYRGGPHRLYVRAARNLAACGVPSLRFDPTGVGDSLCLLPQGPTHAYSAQRLEDTRAALDFAQQRLGVERLVVVGLCSGAYVAFHAGLEDSRVVSQILINLQTFRWQEGDTLDVALRSSVKSSEYYGRLALRRETWRRFLRGELHAVAVLSALIRRRLTFHRGVLRALERSLDLGRRALFIFSEDDGGRDVYGAEIGAKEHPLLQLEIVPRADHTFSAGWAQRWLLARIGREVLHLASEPAAVAG